MSKRGLFITLEGGEGSGKTTQITRLRAVLADAGYDVVLTREPGGTAEAEKIRHLLVHRDGGDWTAMAECLLLFAGRHMHVEKLIKPALAAGKVVISDRFADSTRAYQSYGGGLAPETVEAVNRLTLGDFAPDLTFILDLPVEEGLCRAGRRMDEDQSAEDRFESKGAAFHERMRQGFLAIARNEPERCAVIDAARDADDIAADLAAITLKHLREKAA